MSDNGAGGSLLTGFKV